MEAHMDSSIEKVTFGGAQGDPLAARLDRPAGPVRATAIFAHCFTCSNDLAAVRTIAGELAGQGVAVLRFDFTGLGASGGEFANTNFSSNCSDLKQAAAWLRDNIAAPSLLIGHSLGGAAVLAIAADIPEAKAVAVINAPADAEHVVKAFSARLDEIETSGEAHVKLAGRSFRIKKQFLDDLGVQNVRERIAQMRKPLLILHAPRDEIVGIDNATAIFTAARHPKSFISLDDADHLLTDARDARYVAEMIAAWASRFLPAEPPDPEHEHGPDALATETGHGKFQAYLVSGPHRLFADEPEELGGLDSGPSPYDFLALALASCTSMTLRLYAEQKQLPLGRVRVAVSHAKVHARDCAECTDDQLGGRDRIDRFERTIGVEGGVPPELREKLLEIAGKCPVHRTLEAGAVVASKVEE
jgi:putative redox protein